MVAIDIVLLWAATQIGNVVERGRKAHAHAHSWYFGQTFLGRCEGDIDLDNAVAHEDVVH